MLILVVNCGSSSLKFQLFEIPELKATTWGLIEQIGEESGHLRVSWMDAAGVLQEREESLSIPDHEAAVEIMARELGNTGHGVEELAGIGHRVVHGGEMFRKPTIIDQRVIETIEELFPLAPLHNPANLTGIRLTMNKAPDVPQVAVFDTSFHQSIPEHAFMYAIPRRFYEQNRVRRYGFHGTSHHYVSKRAAEFLGLSHENAKVITLHLGNGASAAAVSCGRCVDTSMGLTPLEGLVMGTRSGDLDPAILFYLNRETGMSMDELDRMLNRQSGLLGLCGENDMRTIIEKAETGEPHARLALEIFCYRIKKYIGAYLAVLGGADCIVFTGGIGENAALVRELSTSGLEGLGIVLDRSLNQKLRGMGKVSASGSRTAILVVPTDEEYEIAWQTLKLIQSA